MTGPGETVKEQHRLLARWQRSIRNGSGERCQSPSNGRWDQQARTASERFGVTLVLDRGVSFPLTSSGNASSKVEVSLLIILRKQKYGELDPNGTEHSALC